MKIDRRGWFSIILVFVMILLVTQIGILNTGLIIVGAYLVMDKKPKKEEPRIIGYGHEKRAEVGVREQVIKYLFHNN